MYNKMKKKLLKSVFKLRVFNDGSTAYIWGHPWRNWIHLSNKDMTLTSLWNSQVQTKKVEEKTSHLQKYTSNFKD